MGTGNGVVLALILGSMIAFDMGGPINKTAFFFGAAMIREGNYQIMGACAAAIGTPPLGMGLATLLQKKLWTTEEQEAGLAGIAMGLIGITEGAIPFAAADPLRVIPSIMVGSAIAAVIAIVGGVGDHAPHGGPIVLPVVDHRLVYALAIVTGTVVTAILINLLKSRDVRFTHRSKEEAV
jgi:PTS system fructose-specific IIC component